MDASGWNMWVFRDGRKTVKGEWLINGLSATLTRSSQDVLSALLWAGELECALSDSSPPNEPLAKIVTDELASALVSGAPPDSQHLHRHLAKLAVPPVVRVSVTESFAYYALHPLRFAEFAQKVTQAPRVRVVGIRSIGTTLSAVVAAALRQQGIDVQRLTVRPTGHAYDRELEFTSDQRKWINDAQDADFLVVDEGPGLSGSSFLATAEAIESTGVANDRIILLGTSLPVPENLRATNAAQRWRRFRSEFISCQPVLPGDADLSIGAGEWRSLFLPASDPPGSWTQLESRKYLSRDKTRFYRFEGFGRYGAEVGERATRLSDFGFSPKYLGNVQGFGCYKFLPARPMTPSEASLDVLHRLASYCALRAREFAVTGIDAGENESMLRHNFQTIFQTDLKDEARLKMVRPVITDGRMLPRKWLCAADGVLYKVDAVTHGDDHFAPGPCDIAWDLAGTIVEWQLDFESRERFVAEYEKQSGDDVRPRLGPYLLAYSTFRCAYSKMASQAMSNTEEESRLHRDYLRYRDQAFRIYQSEFPKDQAEVAKAEVV